MHDHAAGVVASIIDVADKREGMDKFEGPQWVCAVKGGAFQWVQGPPGDRSSRKQPEQSWR